MDEEDKLPLFGVQPEDFYNTEGQGTVGDTMLGGLGLGGAAFAAQTGRAPTPTPTGPMSSLAQRVAANDAANRAGRPTQPSLIGQGTASKITSGLLSGTIGAPSLILNPTSLGDATVSGAIERMANQNMAQGMSFTDAYNQAQNSIAPMKPVEPLAAPALAPAPTSPAPALASTAAELDSGRTNPVSSVLDFFLGAPSPEAAGQILDTMPTSVNQRERLLRIAEGENVPSDAQKAAQFLFGRGEGDPNILSAEPTMTASDGTTDTIPTTPRVDELIASGNMTPTGEMLAQVNRGGAMDTGVAQTQAELLRQFGGSTIGQILQQPEFGLPTDPQGRMIPSGFSNRAGAFPGYEAASAEREARIAARPDFMEARPSAARQDGAMSMAQATELSGGDRDVARRMVELSKMGRDPLTGKLAETPEQRAAELRSLQARTAYYENLVEKAKKEDPSRVKKFQDEAKELGYTGAEREAYILGQLGGASIEDIRGFPGPNEETDIPTITSQAEYDALPSGVPGGTRYFDSSGALAIKK